MSNERLSVIIRWVLELVFVFGLLCIASLRYFLSRYYMWFFNGDSFYYNFVITVLYLGGGAGLVIIRKLIAIFISISKQNPFVYNNVKSLKIISYCCYFIASVFLVKWFFYPSLITLAAIFIFVIGGLCAFVFGRLFGQAVVYKSENDLTI